MQSINSSTYIMENINEGINLFNNSDYFSAHDFFEDLWMEADIENRLFFQGLVQVSVGSYHLLNNNLRGALNQYRKSVAKLKNYTPVYMNVQTGILIEKVEILISDLEKYFDEKINFVDINKIPKLEQI